MMPGRMTPQSFIQKTKEIHGDKYDYSEIKFVHSQEKVPIICKKHGRFFQYPQKHLSGQGCRLCSYEKTGSRCRMSVDDFIKKARSIHSNKYKYDKVIYRNNQTKITITCPIHGDFEMTPANHTHKTQPQGCPQCGGKTYWTKEKFIIKSKRIHGEKYSYFKVNFVSVNEPVTIICSKHGDFLQKPSKHLAGQGCPYCSGTKKLTTEQFIERAKAIHGDKYIYDKVIYINTHSKVIITCPLHGDFEMTPANHTHKTQTQGCPKCSGKKVFNTIDFITVAKEIHDDLYDYPLTHYTDSQTPVKIVCPYHGVFSQKPNVHLQGCGCPKCRSSKGEHKIEECLKELKINYEYQYSFPDCKYKNPLFFDFMICINNKIALIEFYGEQHYKNINFGSNNTIFNFEEIHKRDEIKKEYCKKNNIPLLVISYDEYSNTKEKIKDFVAKLK